MIKHKKCTKCRWTNFVKSIDFWKWLWYCMGDVNVLENEGENYAKLKNG